ncbi:MAG: hypothetical protein II441_04470, partial [Oscillospiraceae bacterium]|nr:hypothetical protein [Oscillospiraceae bacterium]
GINERFVYDVTYYRNFNEVLLKHVEEEVSLLSDEESLVVMMGSLVVTNPLQKILHNQTTQRLVRKLETKKNVSVFTVPYVI